MAWTKTKTSIIAAVVVLILAGGAAAIFIAHHRHQPRELKDLWPSVRQGHHEEQLAQGTFLRSQPVRSQTSRIVFHNNTSKALQLFWLDFDGQRKKYGDIPPRSSFHQGTYANHPWLLVDGDDHAVALFVAAAGSCVATIHP